MNRLVMMILKNFHRVPGAYWKICHYAKHTEEYPEQEKYDHVRYIFNRAIKGGNIEVDIHGQEHIPQENGFLMYSNHQGLFDIIALVSAMEKPWGVVLKQELYKLPLIKQMVDCTKSFPMNREDVKQSMGVIQAVTEEVKNGRNYLIFPEGTRSKLGNELLEFHGGSFKCATRAKCPILPIALIDCFKVLDQKGSKPLRVQLHFLPAIPFEEYQGMTTKELAAMVRERIQAKIQNVLVPAE
ncbi:MAG: 1-acyl-sn-glycerol-3-phosphate acyltransferase [Lachnospiraceae bacterium]|nr:1-acyl-sn-glycerol-3-phosphate acyltransferase [Lachnospiraceae bacterium]